MVMKKITFKFFKHRNISKEKKIFLWGILNLVFTNILLQILLLFAEIKNSTLIAQIFNIIFGYAVYSKKVFNINKYCFRKFFFYVLLAFFSWNFNWFFILRLYDLGFNKNLSAIMIAPILACNSYLIQKYFIFNKLSKNLFKKNLKM